MNAPAWPPPRAPRPPPPLPGRPPPAAHAEGAVLTGPGPSPGLATRVFHQAPAAQGHPHDALDPLAAELAGWASGELPGQASEQLATWAAAESAPSRAVDRPHSAR